MANTTDTINVAERRAALAAELAELDAIEARQAADAAVDSLVSWMGDPASVPDLGPALTTIRDAVIAVDPAAWPNGPRARTNGSGTKRAKGGTGKAFDADAVLAYLAEQSGPVVMRSINAALGTKATSKDMAPLAESGKVVITGKAPQFKYALA